MSARRSRDRDEARRVPAHEAPHPARVRARRRRNWRARRHSASASACLPARYNASTSLQRNPSRNGCSLTSCSSSPTISRWRPSTRSSSSRCSNAPRRASPSRSISTDASDSNSSPSSTGPRHSESASRNRASSTRGVRLHERERRTRHALEHERIDRFRRDVERVAWPMPAQFGVHTRVRKSLADPRRIDLQGVHPARRRTLTPDLVRQPLRRHHLARPQQQHPEQHPCLQRQTRLGLTDLQRAQDPKRETHPTTRSRLPRRLVTRPAEPRPGDRSVRRSAPANIVCRIQGTLADARRRGQALAGTRGA